MPEDNKDFASWLRERALAAGYDVDSAKGGRTELAEAAGMSVTQIGRTLSGETIPSIGSLRGLSRALRLPLSEMLIRAKLATPDDFPAERPRQRRTQELWWHRDLGLKLAAIYHELIESQVAVSQAYQEEGRAKTALSLLARAQDGVMRARSEMEEVLFSEHPDEAETDIYYPAPPDVETYLSGLLAP